MLRFFINRLQLLLSENNRQPFPIECEALHSIAFNTMSVQHFFPFGFTFRIPFIELSNGWTQFNWEQSGAREGAEKGGDDVMFRQRSTKFQMCKEKTVHAFVWCVLWRLFSVEWENVWEKLMMSISEGNNQKNKLDRKPAWIRIYIFMSALCIYLCQALLITFYSCSRSCSWRSHDVNFIVNIKSSMHGPYQR